MGNFNQIKINWRANPTLPAGTALSLGVGPLDLFHRGVLIPIEISTPTALRVGQNPAALLAMTVYGLFDTGCTITSIDDSIAQHLKLSPTGVTTTRTASGPRQSNTYVADISLPSTSLNPFSDMNISSCNLGFKLSAHQSNPSDPLNFGILIGRDMMSKWHITWNGPTSAVFISD